MLREIGTRELIFMTPHHGSKTSSSLALLKRLDPDQAFAQNGAKWLSKSIWASTSECDCALQGFRYSFLSNSRNRISDLVI
jgi:hypothetical protein